MKKQVKHPSHQAALALALLNMSFLSGFEFLNSSMSVNFNDNFVCLRVFSKFSALSNFENNVNCNKHKSLNEYLKNCKFLIRVANVTHHLVAKDQSRSARLCRLGTRTESPDSVSLNPTMCFVKFPVAK